jgi:thioredoxin-like negative regulator of GroEL
MLGPVMDQVASMGIKVDKINVDYETDRTVSANISSVPTVVLAENGVELRRFVGAKTLQQVLDFYNS